MSAEPFRTPGTGFPAEVDTEPGWYGERLWRVSCPKCGLTTDWMTDAATPEAQIYDHFARTHREVYRHA